MFGHLLPSYFSGTLASLDRLLDLIIISDLISTLDWDPNTAPPRCHVTNCIQLQLSLHSTCGQDLADTYVVHFRHFGTTSHSDAHFTLPRPANLRALRTLVKTTGLLGRSRILLLPSQSLPVRRSLDNLQPCVRHISTTLQPSRKEPGTHPILRALYQSLLSGAPQCSIQCRAPHHQVGRGEAEVAPMLLLVARAGTL